jgi:hypothetical protein
MTTKRLEELTIPQERVVYLPAPTQETRIVYVERGPKRVRRPNWALLFMTPFLLSFIAFVFLVFALDDLTWLLQRMALIIAVTFMGGTVLTVIVGIGMAVYDTLFGRIDYE